MFGWLNMFNNFFLQIKAYASLIVVIVFVVVLAVSNWDSYQHGRQTERGAAAVAQVAAVATALAEFKVKADLDQKEAVKAETKRQESRIAAVQRRHNLVNDIQKNPRLDCSLNAVSYGLLLTSITASNGLTSTSGTPHYSSPVSPSNTPR